MSLPMSAPPIEDHALIGNGRTAALVTRDAMLTWLCWPRFDSAAVFSALLGDDEHGFWRVAPARDSDGAPTLRTRRRYAGNSAVLEQEWSTPLGSARVTLFMPAPDATGYAPARIVWVVEGLTGKVDFASEFHPRPGYGSLRPVFHRVEHSGQARLVATSGHDSFCLDGPLHSVGQQGPCRADFTVAAGQKTVLALSWQPADLPLPAPTDSLAELADALRFWESWASTCTYQGPHRAVVLRALVTLKLMCSADGGMVAAPTTSLPEALGGERNWDYRFAWLRDWSLAVKTMVRCGFLDEARTFREWLLAHVDPVDPGVLYGIGGETGVEEYVLDHLPGYEGSRPVRVGNGAAGQLQLDVPGEVADALLAAEDAGLAPDPDADRWLLLQADVLEQRWRDPDEGIWEVRGPRRHFTHSKILAWVFFDRLVTLLERRTPVDSERLEHLRAVREEIHADVCARGLDPQRGAFTQYYGGEDLDASLLLIPALGFLPGDDKRVIATVEAVQREQATPDGLVHRYLTHAASGANVDGLAGREGAFLPCAFWLADALHAIGYRDAASELLDRLLVLRNDVGLLAEEYDPVSDRQLGNYPQAFSMLALVDSCLAQQHQTVALPTQPRPAPAVLTAVEAQ
ncbi:glycoside hydrolase family 15 protein [Kitasatospora sp. NPDC058046]|uniref:glycoside hydrolase family 15 protein n=1 Tax=Kitasatospora sp. NPDC058046 TaxID=3346312 RepID=UPI0036DD5D41